MRAARSAIMKTREISWVDETFTVLQRSRVVALVKEACAEDDPDGRKLTVIDVGCYDGRLYWYLEQNHLFPQYVGLDIRIDYLEEARRKLPKGRASVTDYDLTLLTSAAMSLNEGDVVVCLEVLEHVNLPYTVLGNLFNLAKPGGLVVVGTPVNTRGRTFHHVDSETNLGHVGFLVHEDVMEVVASWGHELWEATPGWSLKSRYRIPLELDEPWASMRKRLGPAFRPIYLACMDEPNGGGFYVWRKKMIDQEAR